MDDCCGSSEKIASEFMANGRPAEAVQPAGQMLGGFEVLTPKEGKGFVDWAVNGYKLDGCHKDAPEGVDYDKCGDWRFDNMISTTEYEKK